MIDLDADTLTLRRRPVLVEQYDGTPPPFAIVQSSPVVSRRPKDDLPMAVLLQRAMRTPETFTPPQGMAFCSKCGDWRPESYFVKNPSRKRGYDYECKQCKRERMAWFREAQAQQAEQEGRGKRRYYKAA